jgi:hypothetical protein
MCTQENAAEKILACLCLCFRFTKGVVLNRPASVNLEEVIIKD